MVRTRFKLVLWLLVLVQSIGLCRCLAMQTSGPEYVTAAHLADGISGDQDDHQDRPGEQVTCDIKVSLKADSDQSDLFVALLTPALFDTLPPPCCLSALPVDAVFAPTQPHQGRNLPLLI
jgi:hypothetical protein